MHINIPKAKFDKFDYGISLYASGKIDYEQIFRREYPESVIEKEKTMTKKNTYLECDTTDI